MTVDLRRSDALAVLRTLPAASIDAVVTDPPYGLAEHKPAVILAAMAAWCSGDREHVPDGRGFMGRSWDSFVPPPAVWDECLRVLKPGGHLLCFAAPRTMDLMGLSVRLAGFEMRDVIGNGLLAWIQGQGFPKGKTLLKPAWEPIIVARKPCGGSEAACVAAHGTGALNIDGCRVGTGDDRTPGGRQGSHPAPMSWGEATGRERPTGGRWPTNVVLTHAPCCGETCVDGCPVVTLDAQSGNVRSAGNYPSASTANGMFHAKQGQLYADSGGASRFFPTFRYQAKAPTSERPKIDGKGWPTVKPLGLMRWLVRLVTLPGGLVLDPFAGTGATLQAAELEGLDSLGIEDDAFAHALACQRLGIASALPASDRVYPWRRDRSMSTG